MSNELIELNDPNNFIFDGNKVVIDPSENARLKLLQGNQDYTIDFNSDTGFTYDSSKVEFVGGQVQQIDKRPVNSLIGARLFDSVNANWAVDGASLIPTLSGTPVISGNKLSCVGSNGLYYQDTQFANGGNFVAKFKYTPNYSTSPATNVNLFAISEDTGTNNDVVIFNSPSGNNIRITSNGLSAITFGVWEPTALQEYVFEVICINNVVTLYIDNVQLGTSKTITPDLGAISNKLWLGAYAGIYNTSDGSFSDFIFYTSASQTDTYEIPLTAYPSSIVTTPELEKVGDGTIKQFNTFTTTESGSPKYTIQIGRSGDYLYWDGVAWVVSNNTYSQANDSATFNAKCQLLDIDGEIYGQFRIYFDDTNIQGAVDELTANINADIGYSTDVERIQLDTNNITILADQLLSLLESVNKTGSDDVTYVLGRDSSPVYWDGLNWVASDYTLSQSNTIAEIIDGKNDFLQQGAGAVIGVNWLLKSDDGSTTPEVINLNIGFDPFGEQPVFIESTYYSTLVDLSGTPIEGAIIKVRPNWIIANASITDNQYISTTTNVNGYWELKINIEDVEPDYLVWDVNGKIFQTNYVQGTIKFSELPLLYC